MEIGCRWHGECWPEVGSLLGGKLFILCSEFWLFLTILKGLCFPVTWELRRHGCPQIQGLLTYSLLICILNFLISWSGFINLILNCKTVLMDPTCVIVKVSQGPEHRSCPLMVKFPKPTFSVALSIRVIKAAAAGSGWDKDKEQEGWWEVYLKRS